TTATLGPSVAPAETPVRAPDDTDELQIPLHRLTGDDRLWANRLIRLFYAKPTDGVEGSVNFTRRHFIGDRFLSGVQRANWDAHVLAALPRALLMPQRLWHHVQQDMAVARALYCGYEPGERGGTYRVYLEIMPAADTLRQAGTAPLGRGYKWNPSSGETA